MGTDGPLVVACLRPTDLRPAVDGLTGQVGLDLRAETTSAADQAALEHALTLAEAWGGRAVAVVAGPPAVDATLRQALAVGAGSLRVPWAEEAGAGWLADVAGDEQALAAALAAAIRGLAGGDPPALVVCGDRSPDRGTGALPAFLAAELGAAQALGLVSLTWGPPDRGADVLGGDVVGGDVVGAVTLRGERRLDGGRRERLSIPRPAVVSVEAAGLRLRRAGLPATLAAARAAVPVAAAPPVGPLVGRSVAVRVGSAVPYRPRTKVLPAPDGGDAHRRLLQLTGALVAHEPPTLVGPTDAAGAADALLDHLARHGWLPEERGPLSAEGPPS